MGWGWHLDLVGDRTFGQHSRTSCCIGFASWRVQSSSYSSPASQPEGIRYERDCGVNFILANNQLFVIPIPSDSY